VPGSATNQRPYVGVATLVWHQGKLLLGERVNPGAENCWQFPGGHLEYAEDVLSCAQREVREETGLEIHQLKLAGYSKDLFITNARHYVTLFVSAQRLRGEPELREPDKCLRWQWFSPSRLPAPLFTPIVSLLKTHPDLLELA
jgi:8-oxo-dGTP diphosphatase